MSAQAVTGLSWQPSRGPEACTSVLPALPRRGLAIPTQALRDIREPGARNVVALGTEGHLRSIGVATVSAWVAHAFAWAAGVWLAFWPTYEGASVTATLPGEPGGEVIRSSATAIEVNGLHVILLLLVPILLTAITLLGLRLQQTTMRKILLWSPAVVLLGFCFVAIASIGMFYLPTALALLVAAIADLGGQEGNEPI